MNLWYKSELSTLLSDSEVLDNPIALAHANLATFQTTKRSQLIVKVGSVEDIAKLLQFSTKNELSIYVISRGKNWGFGSKVPVQDTEILLDLSSMNKILSYDQKYGVVRIEAGVTFLQLSTFLKENGNRHFLNIIGGDPNASVLGNVLERGDGIGPYCERADYISSPEVILANGKIINIGFGNIQHSKLADLDKHGLGPDFLGLFLQSNYGIVSKISVWLCRIPKHFRLLQVNIKKVDKLRELLINFKELYEKRILDTPISFWNDYKQAACTTQYPWRQKDMSRALDRSYLRTISNDYGAWSVFGGIYVDQFRIGKLIEREIIRCFRQSDIKTSFFSVLSNQKINLFRFLAKFRIKFFDQLIFDWEQSPLLGHTTNKSVRSLYWRKRRVIPDTIYPEVEFCGVLWNAFMIPFDGELVCRVLLEVEKIIFAYEFEPVISFVISNSRYVRVFQQLIFDRENLDEDKRAIECHQKLFDYLETSGFSHSRLDILSMDHQADIIKDDSIHIMIKEALDPKRVISPGRYFL